MTEKTKSTYTRRVYCLVFQGKIDEVLMTAREARKEIRRWKLHNLSIVPATITYKL